MSRAFTPPDDCPVCGEPVPRGAKACPECGADERSGWDEEATRYDGLDLPDGTFDDTDESTLRPASRAWIGITSVVVVLGLLILFLFPR